MTKQRENALLERTEVFFEIEHPQAATPTRAEIRKSLAGALDPKGGVLILDWARSQFGRTTTRGYAKLYKSKEQALALETPPILIRNGLLAKPKKAEAAPEAPAPPPKREAPKEAPPKDEKKEPPRPAKEEKKEAPRPAPKEEKKEAPKPAKEGKEPAKKAEAPKEKKPAAKKEGR